MRLDVGGSDSGLLDCFAVVEGRKGPAFTMIGEPLEVRLFDDAR